MRALATVTLLLLTGCSTAPISVQEITPQAPDDAFSCAMSQLNAWGLNSGNETGVAPSDSGEADANSIVETCAEGVEGVSGRLDS